MSPHPESTLDVNTPLSQRTGRGAGGEGFRAGGEGLRGRGGAENPLTFRLSPQEHSRLRRQHARRRALTAYSFLLPNAIFFIAFLLFPVIFLFYLTFHSGGIITPAEFVGLQNWQRAWSDELVRTTIRNTVYYCLLAI